MHGVHTGPFVHVPCLKFIVLNSQSSDTSDSVKLLSLLALGEIGRKM